jgi:aminoglycoside 6'-N-acetyltransferase I
MRIGDLAGESPEIQRAAAKLLCEAFAEGPSSPWTDASAAMDEVLASTGRGRLARAAIDDDERLAGWVGAISTYDGHVWEVHPLVVRADRRRQGVGRALLQDLEREVQRLGGLTLWVGTDDDRGVTSVGGRDLYPDPLGHLAQLEGASGHPFHFYRKIGFVLAGVVPDANGPGLPDILLAKRVAPAATPASSEAEGTTGAAHGTIASTDQPPVVPPAPVEPATS